MQVINNITTDREQQHIIKFEETEIILTLKYLTNCLAWLIDVEYKNKKVYGIKLANKKRILLGQNLPFDFATLDNSKTGLDPMLDTDFNSGRCTLFLLERADLLKIRGYDVAI